MKNLLLELEENLIEHFITKSYITASFEEEESRTEYHIYHKHHHEIGKWNEKCQDYQYLKSKPLSKVEVRWFRSNIHRYRRDCESSNGSVWVNKSVGFSKKQTKWSNQLLLF